MDNAAASTLGIKLTHVPVSARSVSIKGQQCQGTDPNDLEDAFAAVKRSGVEAVYVKADALFVVNRALIAQLALKHRLPMMCADGRFADAGALLSYGENFISRYERAAELVYRILTDKRSKPAIPPVEQASSIELVVNSKTANALGIPVPQSILVQAGRVIR
jgi:putative ABC transport system substrate-binding protein